MKVCIVGLGYMGLPTAFLLAKAGETVVGYDINTARVQQLNNGNLPFEEKGLVELYQAAKQRFSATTTLGEADVYLIAVPTPFTATKTCDLSFVKAATEAIAPHVRKGNLVILESTVSPGTTTTVVKPILEARGLQAGTDFSLAYVSEKAIPGNTLHEMVHNDRVIGAFDERSGSRAATLYALFVQGNLHITDCTSAETVKLVENAYRDVNIAFANELANICSGLGINVWEIVSLANKHPRVHVHQPGPGVGGHCIAIDPWFLIEEHPGKLIATARSINDARPHHVASFVKELLKSHNLHSVGILGVAYKPDVDDSRESPAIELIAELQKAGHTVVAHDPHVQHFPYPLERNLAAVLNQDIIVIITNHKEYYHLPKLDKPVVDTRHTGYEPCLLLGRDF